MNGRRRSFVGAVLGTACVLAAQSTTPPAAVAPRDVRLVCPGWDWPEDPARTLAAVLAEGRPLALDLADEAWIGPREVAPREACRAFARAHSTRVVAGFVVIER